MYLPIVLGKGVNNNLQIRDLVELDNIMLGGSTGSGVDEFLAMNVGNLISNVSSDYLKLVLVDLKGSVFNTPVDDDYLFAPVIREKSTYKNMINQLHRESERREGVLGSAGAKTLETYNKVSSVEKLPYIVVFIIGDDGLVEKMHRTRQIGRTLIDTQVTGIYFLISTQRPSSETLDPDFVPAFPTRICFYMPSHIDYERILHSSPKPKIHKGQFYMDTSTTDVEIFDSIV